MAQAAFVMLLGGGLVALAGSPENLHEALEAQRALVAANPGNSDLLNDLGNLLALSGQVEEAEETYRHVLEIKPDDVTGFYNLALVLQEQGKNKEAIKTLKTVIEIDSQHAWAHYQLGTLFASQKDRNKAVRYYETAFALDRSLTSPKVNPHIVENRLVTAALLQLYVSESPSTQAPRVYQKPGDVAELLIPTPAPAADPPATSEAGSRQFDASFESTSETTGPIDEAGSGAAATSLGGDSEVRTIDSENLNSRNQAGSPASSSSDGTEAPPTESASGRDSMGGSPQSVGGVIAPTYTPSSSSDDLTIDQGESLGQPGGSYLPGLQSTGRLDLELLPAPEIGTTVSAS